MQQILKNFIELFISKANSTSRLFKRETMLIKQTAFDYGKQISIPTLRKAARLEFVQVW